MTACDYLILGGGRAGLCAAEAIRKNDKTGSITMISDEAQLPYSRPMLTKLPLAFYEVEKTLVQPESWYREQNITVLLRTKVLSMDAERKTVETSAGTFSYGKCIYAMGAYNFVPPFPGKDLSGVYSIRTDKDMNAIRRGSLLASHAVVIGGGVIGLEAAYMLVEQGLSVTVLETAPYLMPRLLDESCARYLQSRITAFQIHTGVKVLGMRGDARVQFVEVEGMEPIPAGLVIVSCGVRANSEVFQKAGGTVERAIVVDEQMRTNLPDVFACGDCAQYQGLNTALWAQATLQGRVAGVNAAGRTMAYHGSDSALVLNCPEFSLYSDGDCGKRPDALYEAEPVVRRRQAAFEVNPRAEETYVRDYYVNGRLVGTFMLGSLTDMMQKSREIARK